MRVETPPTGELDSGPFRGVEKFKIEMTNSMPYFDYVTEKGVDSDKKVKLDKAVEARYAKLSLTVIKSEGQADATPIALYK